MENENGFEESGIEELDSEDISEESQEDFEGMQDRMEDDSPWYSESEGAVVDVDGNPLEIDGKRFKSVEEYEKALNPDNTENPGNEGVTDKGEKPKHKSFISLPITPETLQDLTRRGDYKYNNELFPKVVEGINKNQPEPANLDPVAKVKAMQRTWNSVAIDPIRNLAGIMEKELVAEGASPSVVAEIVNRVFSPILRKQSDTIENLYREEYEKAIEQRIEGKFGDKLSATERKEIETKSTDNVNRLSQKYFREHGNDALFSIINGYLENPEDKSSFVRGPGAHILDLFTKQLNGGKGYATQEEANKAQSDTFTKLTSDENDAKAFFDIIYHYYLGKNASKASGIQFEEGKKAAAKEQQRISKTTRKRPQAGRSQQKGDPFEGYPSVIKTALLMNR